MGQDSKPAAIVASPTRTVAERLVPAALMALAFGLRLAGLDAQSLWRDEVDAIRFSAQSLPELLRAFQTPGQNGPLYFLLLRPWLAVAGDGEFSLRFFSLFFGVLSVALSYYLARRLLPGPRWAGWVAALLAATSPYLIWYSQEGKMYTLVVALALASMACYLAALRTGDRLAWLGYVAVTTLSFYVHLIAVLLVPAQILMFLLGRWDRRARLRTWLVSLAVLILPYLPLLAWQLPALTQKVETGYRFFPLGEMLWALLTDYSAGVTPATGPFLSPLLGRIGLGVSTSLPISGLWAIPLFGALALAALVLAGRRTAGAWLLAVWLLIPPLLFFLVTLRRPMFTTRYLIFVVPAYLLLIAGGLLAVARRARVAAGLLLAVLVTLNAANAWSQARTPIKADYRGATDYVLDRLASDDLVLFQIPYGRYSFDYYLHRRAVAESARPLPRPSTAARGAYRWAEGLYTNNGLPPDEAERQMAGLVAGSRVVWLIESEAPMWDERGLVHAWLDAHSHLDGEAQFTRVGVYRYILPAP